MTYTSRQLREIFHLLFLARLQKVSDARLFVLKGGVNLRFFFGSPRYSEDMDLDVLAGGVDTLKKNGYGLLEDAAFLRSLAAYGIHGLEVNDPARAKHTNTTQRFRLRLLTDAGEQLPTKIEFSRRGVTELYVTETIDPTVSRPYRQLAFPCQHYPAHVAVAQKVEALAHRTAVQARDVFDLYVLYLAGHLTEGVSEAVAGLHETALAQLMLLDYEDYQGQVLEYLEPQDRNQYGSEKTWQAMVGVVFNFLDSKP